MTLPLHAAVLRILLAAWALDDPWCTAVDQAWVLRHLQDRAWVPSPEDRQRLAPVFLAWCTRVGVRFGETLLEKSAAAAGSESQTADSAPGEHLPWTDAQERRSFHSLAG